MFDCHYDLLTYIYMNKNDIDMVKDYCKKVYNEDNIKGGIFNLFYMSEAEMKEEINVQKDEIDVIENLRLVKELINEYNLIPKGTKYVFGIEGLDYLKNIYDIDKLYELGLRSTNPVWSNKNKFGGGVKAEENCGLTKLGEELINKLVDTKIAIDLSHANEKTFYDIIEVCKKLKQKGKSPKIFASHSNAKALCNVERNLTDEQIKQIKEMDGVIGVVSIKKFCCDKDINSKNVNYEQEYINHINYFKELLGDVNNIAVSSDDMSYYYIQPEYYQNLNVYKHEEIAKKIKKGLIENNYTKEEIEKIMYKNIIDKVFKYL